MIALHTRKGFDRPTGVSSRAALRRFFLYIVIFTFTLTVSIALHEQYKYGDQIFYRSFYDLAQRVDVHQIPRAQRSTTGSSEPVYGILVWIFSRLVEKKIFISIANGIFICQIFAIFERYRGSRLAFVLVASGYYTVVCLLAAERLKFSLIFLMAFLLVPGFLRYAFAALAPAAHFQVVILYVSALAGNAAQRIREAVSIRQLSWRDFLAFISAGAFLAYFLAQNQSPIVDKISGYATLDQSETVKTLLLTAIMLTFCRNRWSVIGFMLPIIIAAYVVGDSRVNMMGYIVFIYFFLLEGRTRNFAFLAINIYFFVQSIEFISNIVRYGTGYPSGV